MEDLLRKGETVIDSGAYLHGVGGIGGVFPTIGDQIIVDLAVETVYRLEPTQELVGGN